MVFWGNLKVFLGPCSIHLCFYTPGWPLSLKTSLCLFLLPDRNHPLPEYLSARLLKKSSNRLCHIRSHLPCHTLISKVCVEEGGEHIHSWKVAFVPGAADRKAPCILMCVPIACRGLGDTLDGVWHSCQQRACLDWTPSLCVCVVPCWLTDPWGQGFAGMWAGCLPWLFVVPEAGRAWSLTRGCDSSCESALLRGARVMGSSVGECSSELQNKTLGCRRTWKEELIHF